MKLHGNAALSLKKRELLVSRVVDERLVADGGGRGRRSQRAHGRQVGRAASGPRASPACSIAPRRQRASTTAPPSDRIQVICALRRLRMTGSEIAEVLRMPETTVSGILDPARAWAGSAGSGSSPPSATSARAPAS